MGKVALYARVSTKDQSVDMQLNDLCQYCKTRNLSDIEKYIDEGISGKKEKRPALDRLMDDIRKGKIKIVLVWKFDRFARSTKHLVTALEEFNHLGVDFISYKENLDTGSPMGKAMFTVISAMAELERDLIVERVKAGQQVARAKGKRFGRPPSFSVYEVEKIKSMRENGNSLSAISHALSRPRSSVHKVVASLGLKSVHKA